MRNMAFPKFFVSFYQVIFSTILLCTIVTAEFELPSVNVIPISPQGLRISVPHLAGLQWVEFIVHIEASNGVEYYSKYIGIERPHNGHWTCEDNSVQLLVGDLIKFTINVVYSSINYSFNKQHEVTVMTPRGSIESPPDRGLANVENKYVTPPFEPKTANVIPLAPHGLRISIPHEQGIEWVSFHLQVNKRFNGLEVGTNKNIVKAHSGQWTYSDKKLQLNVGDVIYYWIHIVHKDQGYNLINQEYHVKELFSENLVTPIPTRSTADIPNRTFPNGYVLPEATILPFTPKGFNISIPHVQGINWVAFHVKYNDEFFGLEAGDSKVVKKSVNNRWIYEDITSKLKVGDVINYWIQVTFENLDYNLIDQTYQVTKLYATSEPTPVTTESTDSNIANVNKQCIKSDTKMFDNVGSVIDSSCKNDKIFEENFNDLKEAKWSIKEYFPNGPDYEFNVYINDPHNLKVRDGKLRITPQLLAKKYGNQFIREGSLTLLKCTGVPGTKDCSYSASSFHIIPPVSTGKITTENTFKFLYGRVEIRAKFPKGDWIYPLVTLEPLHANLPGKERMKMRVASSFGNPSVKTSEGLEIGGTVLRGGVIIPSTEKLGWFIVPDTNVTSSNPWSDSFHTYELYWERSQLTLAVDGNIYASTTDQEILSNLNQPMFVSLAVAVGGHREFPNELISNGSQKPWRNSGAKALLDFFQTNGDWSKNWQDEETDLVVDYVRVYAI